MKFKIIFAIVLLLNTITIFSQTAKKEHIKSGLYQTFADFQANKMEYEIDCSTEKQKIKLHDFLAKPYFDVIHDGKKHTFQKKDVYAFRDCEDRVFRFFDNKEYELAESKDITVYFITLNVAEGKGFTQGRSFYFSAGPTGDIKPLNKENLKYAFPENHKFHDKLDEMFKNDADISEYDSFHKMYKVNHVYEMSLK